ncbi:progesterone receptor [Tupaia chinensis]|uniref:progesterone receptor n=1 Tax=Tupaia chinensis TaxID=246437 RepID=UPI000703D0B5|nr:progesterone receptor [Tupaia chinensis]
MTELKAKDPRAPHVASGANSPTEVGSPLLCRPDAGPFGRSQTSDASPGVSTIPISLDGRLCPPPCQGQDFPDGKAQDPPSLSDVEGVYSAVEGARGAGGGSSRLPEKDSGLLDSVLDTLLAPSGPGQSHASPPAFETTSPWYLFGAELPEGPRAAPDTQGVLPQLMSQTGGKAGDSSGMAGAHKVLPTGLSPSRQLLLPPSGNPPWPGAAVKPAPQPAAVVEVEEEEDGPESEGSARPLLKGKPRALGGTGGSYDGVAAAAGALAPPRGSPSASSAPASSGDFPDCAYPPDAEPKDDAFPLFSDFQPPALKIKEEVPAAARGWAAAHPAALGAVRLPSSFAGAHSGHRTRGFRSAFPKHPRPTVPGPREVPGWRCAASRPDSEASQSPQYSFESLPQKICLICGDEASGCHYGVLTCGSCKVFFKRAMEGQHNYLCAGRNDCIVDKIRRKNCPACRLRKCCQAGMVLGGRKFKKFNKVRVMRALDAVALPQAVGIPNESQALSQRITFSPNQDLQLVPTLINLLMSIEPDVIYAGHDNTKPDTSSSLLTSLNQLGERQLLSVVKWSKSLPGFRNLHIDDQITLIQYSWMSLMVFGLGWRSYKHVSGQMLYFAPDLILNEQRMKESSFYSLCLTMWQIPQEFVKLQVSQEEFLCMKVLLLLNTIPLEGLRSQNQFEEMRSSYIRELIKAIGLRQKGVVSSSQRFYQLTKLLDNLHDLVKQLHLYCLNTFIQSRALSVEFPEMMSEVIAAQLPKILAGMVKPLLFHKK